MSAKVLVLHTEVTRIEWRYLDAEPCGCTPDRDCDRHFLDEDDRMRRVLDV